VAAKAAPLAPTSEKASRPVSVALGDGAKVASPDVLDVVGTSPGLSRVDQTRSAAATTAVGAQTDPVSRGEETRSQVLFRLS
jgi:hypothetical protein